MKKRLIYGTAVFILCSCNSKVEHMKRFIPGTYATSWKTEFGSSLDTLVIERSITNGSDIFTITQKTMLLFTPGRFKDSEYKIHRSIGVFDEANKTVIMQRDGSILSFDPDNMVMSFGATPYKKI